MSYSENEEQEYIKKNGRPSPKVLDILCDIRYFYRRSDDVLFFFYGASDQPGHIKIRRPLNDQEIHMSWQEFVDTFRTRGYSD